MGEVQLAIPGMHNVYNALVAAAPLVPLIDYLFHGAAYRWNHRNSDYGPREPAHQLKGAY